MSPTSREIIVEDYVFDIDPTTINFLSSTTQPPLVQIPFFYTGVNERIDAVVNSSLITVPGTNIPVVDRFMVMYPNNALMATNVDIASSDFSTINQNLNIIPFDGKDIAAVVDKNTGATTAIIAAMDGTDLHYFDCDLTTPPGFINSTSYLQSNIDPSFGPRIEAFGIYDNTFGVAKWTIAGDQLTPLDKIWLFTDITAPFNCISTLTGDQESPYVAAGIGPDYDPNNIGNQQYSFAWGGTTIGNYYAMALDIYGNPITPTVCQQVNSSPTFGVPTDPYDMIAMAHSCNHGAGTVTAWTNNSGDINYKIRTDNNYQFRPGRSEDVKTIPSISMSPNPANGTVLVTNPTSIAKIIITNALGREVFVSQPNATESRIDVSKLPAGNYFVTLNDRFGKTKTQQLVVAH